MVNTLHPRGRRVVHHADGSKSSFARSPRPTNTMYANATTSKKRSNRSALPILVSLGDWPFRLLLPSRNNYSMLILRP
jgi:hypothetical protein